MHARRTNEITFGTVTTRLVVIGEAGGAPVDGRRLRSGAMSKAGLDGRIAFITGAGSGLGAAAPRRLALDGARVVVNDINADAATAVAAEVGGEAQPFDVVDSVAFDAAVDKVGATPGRLDIMVNNP